jgi:hypothetical protein
MATNYTNPLKDVIDSTQSVVGEPLQTGGLVTEAATPGLAIEPTTAFEPTPTPTAPEPVARNLDPTKETVAGQITGLLSGESPYIRQAGQRGVEEAASRGLLSSSLAAGAVERERIKAALPIAQQGAEAYARQGLANQEIAAGLQRQAFDVESKQSLMQAEQGFQLEKMDRDAAIRAQMMDFDSQVRERLAGIEQGYALELEELSSTYDIMQNKDTAMGTMYSDALKSIATFLDDPDMSAAQQKTGLNQITSNLEAGLKFLSGVTKVSTKRVNAPLVSPYKAPAGPTSADRAAYTEYVDKFNRQQSRVSYDSPYEAPKLMSFDEWYKTQ